MNPVDGLNVNLVDDTFCAWLPEAVVTHVKNMEAFVAVSSVMAVFVLVLAVIEELHPGPVFVV
jgi:hypothetical protein